MPELPPSFVQQAANVFSEAFELHKLVVSRYQNNLPPGCSTDEQYWIKLGLKGESLIRAVVCLDRPGLPNKSHDMFLPLKFANDAARDLEKNKGNCAAIVDLIEEVHFDRLAWLAHYGFEAVKKEWPVDADSMFTWPDGGENDDQDLAADNRQPPAKGGKWSPERREDVEREARNALKHSPKATRDQLARRLGISTGSVSGLTAWRSRQPKKKTPGPSRPSKNLTKVGDAIADEERAQQHHRHEGQLEQERLDEKLDEDLDAEEKIKRLAAEQSADAMVDKIPLE